MSNTTRIKIESLRAQARGYLTLAKAHCKAKNGFHAQLYMNTAKRLWSEADSFIDADATTELDMSSLEDLFKGAA